MLLTTLSYAGSESPKSADSSLVQNDSPMESEPNSAENSNSLTMTSPMADDINAELNPPTNVSAKTPLGSVKATSLEYPNNTLDWAIILIGEQYLNLATSVVVPTEDGDAPLSISGIAGSGPISDEIWAITASSGPVKGRLSTVPYYLKISGSKTFQRTWMAFLEDYVGL